jgi:integrase
MPRPRPPYLVREVSRHGRVKWYVRIDPGDGKRGPRIRIPGEYGSEEFTAAYNAALSGAPPPVKKSGEARHGTVEWLINEYRKSSVWKAFSHGTRKQREPILRQMIASAGGDPLQTVTRKSIVTGRDRRSATPRQSAHFMATARSLFGWALEADLMPYDPTSGVKNPTSKKKGSGFPVWQEEWVQKYEERWPLGTKERVWLSVLMYSGMRRSDVVRYGRQHISGGSGPLGVRNGIGTIKLKKGNETIEVHLPILPELTEALEAGPVGDLSFIVGERGLPLTPESFGNMFREACKGAGVPGRAHGLRKLAATRAANNGASDKQLQALFGWIDYKMPQLYTRAADRRKLSIESINKIAGERATPKNTKRTSMPAPNGKVRALRAKDK